jgi:hypothetical protein
MLNNYKYKIVNLNGSPQLFASQQNELADSSGKIQEWMSGYNTSTAAAFDMVALASWALVAFVCRNSNGDY